MGISEFRLPDLGEGLEDAEIARWLVGEGDEVGLNQPLVEADTAKALVEIPSPVAGRVAKLHAKEGETVRVGAVLVTFEVEGETPGSARRSVLVGYGVEGAEPPARRRRLGGGDPKMSGPTGHDAIAAAPPVRRLARDMRVELAAIRGTGPGGRITREDVLAAARPAEDAERIAVRGVRRLVAEKMARAVSEIPHVTTFLTIDATEVLKLREVLDVKPLAVVAKAFVEICRTHPKLNAAFDAESMQIVLHRRCHLGIATDTERGLIVPVIRDCDLKSVPEIGSEIARLALAAREGKATPEELSGSTVTISNVGSFGAEFGTPIINHPESAILALGVIEERAAVVDGKVAPRPQAVLSLSFDHRILDGAEAGRALLDLKKLLENADRLQAAGQAGGGRPPKPAAR